MNARLACSACGGFNASTATFCGQCFNPVAAPAASSSRPDAGPFVFESTSAAPATEARGRSKTVTLLLGLVALVVGALSAYRLVGGGTTSFEAPDGSYTLSYSSDWHELDPEGLPVFSGGGVPPGMRTDLALENEHSAVVAMHFPAPAGLVLDDVAAGQVGQVMEENIQQFGFPLNLTEINAPGELKIEGRKVALEGTGQMEFMGTSASMRFLATVSDGAEPQLFYLAHVCETNACTESTPEFESIVRSVSFP